MAGRRSLQAARVQITFWTFIGQFKPPIMRVQKVQITFCTFIGQFKPLVMHVQKVQITFYAFIGQFTPPVACVHAKSPAHRKMGDSRIISKFS